MAYDAADAPSFRIVVRAGSIRDADAVSARTHSTTENRPVSETTTDSTALVDEVRTWLDENWDPDLTVAQWWERLGLAGWSAPIADRCSRESQR